MSTAARNINIVQSVTGAQTFVYGNGATTSLAGVMEIRRKVDIRPASVRSGFYPGTKLRLHGNYSREVMIGTYNGGTAHMIRKQPLPSPSVVNSGTWTDGCFWSGPLEQRPGYTFAAWHKSKATMAALEKLRDSPADFGLMLAEVRQTAGLVGDTAIGIASAVANYRRTRPRDWAKVTRNQVGNRIVSGRRGRNDTSSSIERNRIPDSWLQLQYGWKPLMSDIQGASQALSDKNSNKPFYNFAHGIFRSKQIIERRIGGGPFQYGSSCTTTLQTDRLIGARCDLVYKLRNPVLALFSSLGLTNPASIVWEKVPYSFVADWFLPVGSWLSSVGADAGWDFVTGSTTEFVRQKQKLVGTRWSSTNPDYEFYGSNPAVTQKYLKFARLNLLGAPVPGLHFNPEPLNLTRMANALSLLVNVFSASDSAFRR